MFKRSQLARVDRADQYPNTQVDALKRAIWCGPNIQVV